MRILYKLAQLLMALIFNIVISATKMLRTFSAKFSCIKTAPLIALVGC